ncbi:hypothetical protein PAHAL_6G279300 [Panicum hallii]|uniref:Uncharacterized protein n=1 Tax=Panicum hallii TaxID=206008 RepID=A0A2S3I4A0_9POAL|nr:hypothetical protein PAHAL_6G279300 [Panicum hallii]
MHHIDRWSFCGRHQILFKINQLKLRARFRSASFGTYGIVAMLRISEVRMNRVFKFPPAAKVFLFSGLRCYKAEDKDRLLE